MKVLSLFCGCGGLDMGFANAGYNIIWANDIDHYACQTYAVNFGNHVIEGDIFKIVKEIDPDIITIGADQSHDVGKLQEALDKRGFKAKAVRIEKYRDCELDSSCKIIRKIENTDFEGKILDHCED